MFENWKRIIVITGHYGVGKTNLAVNLALSQKQLGRSVVLVDLDIVNPYFRSADFSEMMQQADIEMVIPLFAGSNLDLPGLTAQLDAMIDSKKTLLIDVGGDDAGAAALGRYSAMIAEAGGCEMLYVVNRYRYLTQTAVEAKSVLREIEQISHMKLTGIVNNSSLGEITTPEDVENSMDFAHETARLCGLPLLFTAVEQTIAERLQGKVEDLYPVKLFVKKPWES